MAYNTSMTAEAFERTGKTIEQLVEQRRRTMAGIMAKKPLGEIPIPTDPECPDVSEGHNQPGNQGTP